MLGTTRRGVVKVEGIMLCASDVAYLSIVVKVENDTLGAKKGEPTCSIWTTNLDDIAVKMI